MIVRKNNVQSYMLGFVFLLMVLVGYTPILHKGFVFFLTGMISIAVLVFNIGRKCIRNNNALIVNVLFYIIMCCIYKVLNISTAGWGAIFLHTLFFIPILLMPFVTVSFSKSQSRYLFLMMVAVVVANIIDNIRLVLANPELLVMTNRNFLTEELDGIGNVGGSKWLNSVFFFFMVCFFFYINSKDKLVRHATFFSAILSGLFVIAFCVKASVIVFTILSAVLLVYAKRTKKFSRFLSVGVFSAVFAFLFVVLFADVLIDFLLSTAPPKLASRLIMLIDSDNMNAGSGVRTMDARENLWFVSIDSWLSNIVTFFFGIGDHRASEDISSVAKTGIGNHSDLFDSLGRYGLIGGLLILNIFRLSFNFILSLFDKNRKLQLMVIFMILILYGFTKGIFVPGVGCAMFLMLPIISIILQNEDVSLFK
jgi:hypothetical protein